MKRNAMLRIVLWSLLALILLSILLTGLFGYVGRNSYRFDTYETAIPSPLVSEPVIEDITVYITSQDAAAYARPDKDSEITANYPKSSYIICAGTISTPDAHNWVIVDGGYIPMEDLSTVEPGSIIAATATQQLSGYGQPVAEGATDFVFPAGSLLTLTQVASASGEIWGYESTQNVWVPMELVELGQGVPQNAAQETIPAATAAPSMGSDAPFYVTLRDTSVYADADAASDIVENLPAESYLYIIETVGTAPAWAAVSIDSVTAYIPMADLLPIPQDVIFPAVVREDADAHSAPNERSKVVSTFEEGTTLGIGRIEMVGDEAWGHLDAEQLWIPMSRVHIDWDKNSKPAVPEDAAAPTETEPNPALADRILFDPKQVRNLEIDWAAGSVTIAPSNVGRITISETTVDRPEEALAYTLHGDTLRIRYYEKKTNPNFNLKHSKDLTILVPRDFALNGLSIDTASADLSVTDMTIGQADVDGASGRCRFENCQLGSLSVDTVSGDVFVSGTATELDVDSTSAAINAQLTNVPSEISADTVSGNLELTLPENAGFTMELETLSGNFRSDFDTTKNGSVYRSGDGRCEIEVDSVSGDVTIRKG